MREKVYSRDDFLIIKSNGDKRVNKIAAKFVLGRKKPVGWVLFPIILFLGLATYLLSSRLLPLGPKELAIQPTPKNTISVNPTPSEEPYQINVKSNSYWKYANIVIDKGSQITFSSSGAWSHGAEGSVVPFFSGIGYNKIDNTALLPTENMGALIGKIGNCEPFLIGKYFIKNADCSGFLFLAMNDVPGNYGDNEGELEVKIWISSQLDKNPTKNVSNQPTKQLTPTIKPVHNILIFEENFSEDKLGWKGQMGVTSVNNEGLLLEYPINNELGEWMGILAAPKKSLQIDGDCTFQIKFRSRVRFSGILFNNNDLGYYAFIIGSGGRADYPPGSANLGLLRPSLGDKAWDNLGDIESLISLSNGNITLKVVFIDNEVQVYINDKLIARRTNEIFKDPKYFGGFYVVNGDKFIVSEIKVWSESNEILQIK